MHHLLIVVCLLLASCSHDKLGSNAAKRELQNALNEHSSTKIPDQGPVKDEQAAIAVSEPILFAIYGEDHILSERPYEAYLIDGNWVLNGTLPKGTLGGTFLMIIKAGNGKVVKITHYK